MREDNGVGSRGVAHISIGATLVVVGLVLIPGRSVTALSFVGEAMVFAGAAVLARGIALRRRSANAPTTDAAARRVDEAQAGPVRPPSRLQAAAMRPRVLARLQVAASPFLPPGETIRHAFYGQTGMPTGFVFLGVLAGKAEMVTVTATDRNLYVFRRGLQAAPRVLGLIASYRIDPSLRVGLRQGAVDLEDDSYWIAALLAQDEAKAFVAYVRSVSDAMRAAEASTPTLPPTPS